MTDDTSTLRHERFCLPRPGESELRTESYNQTKYLEDGVTAIGAFRLTRCLECGCMNVDGQPVAR